MNYAKITDFSNAGLLTDTDKFLIARDGGINKYITYNTTFSQLSSMLKEKISTIELKQSLLTSLAECTSTATTSAVAGNVMSIVNTKTDNLSANVLFKNKSSIQNVTGPVEFTELSVRNAAIDSSHAKNVVNVSMLTSYIDAKLRERPLFSTVFHSLAINNRVFILTDLVPNAYAHTKYTLVLKYKLKANATKTIETKVYNNGTEIIGSVISGLVKLERSSKVDKSWYHIKYYLDLPTGGSQNNMSVTLHNGNYANIDVMMTIHEGHIDAS